MSIREVVITPAMAKELLDRNVNNRKLQVRRVANLAAAMARGEWQYNGDTIRISKSGRLLDGQHRLSAIEKSGVPQKYVIVDGLDDSVFTTIDTGSARGASQMLTMAGEKNTNALASIAKMHLVYVSAGRPVIGNPDKEPTHTQIVEFAESCEQLKKSAQFGSCNGWMKKYITASVVGFCHYEMTLKNPDMAWQFFEEMATGEFSYRDSPIKYIREYLIEEFAATTKTSRERRIAMLFQGFRFYSMGRASKFIRLSKDQADWYKL